nr:uncharacterized mitochondrial protein AtMg00810-like [Tanacetum cinerariifolium]
MVDKSKLDEDPQEKAVDPTRYHGIIGTLMYLTSSRPGLVFDDSCITLTAYADADHAGCQDTRRSTSGRPSGNEVVELYFVIIEHQLADIFTKDLGRERLEFLINKLGMRSMSPETLKKLAEESESYGATADVPEIYMHQFCFKVTKSKDSSSYKFKLDNKTFKGMFYMKNVDYVELIWEDIMYQIDNKSPWLQDDQTCPTSGLQRTEAEEQEDASLVHETHERLVIKKPIVTRKQTRVVMRDTPTVSKKQPLERPQKLKEKDTAFCHFAKENRIAFWFLHLVLAFWFLRFGFCVSVPAFCQIHNNIMAAGSRDHPPMLATGRYPQWRSRFLRYIDTRPNRDALRKCILNGPYIPTIVVVQAVATTDDSPAVPEHTTVETPMNMSPANKAHFELEKEAIHMILTGIRDEIYSTVDAC